MGWPIRDTDSGSKGYSLIFSPTPLKDAYIIEIQPFADERGFFARTWCQNEFEAHGLDSNLAQCSISFNRQKGTLRGMHLQLPPHAETKLVRCIHGAIYDVIIDLRMDSETFLKWFGYELTAQNHRTLYVPKGFAHGFLTLEDNTEVYYMISEFYAPDDARGIRWNDKCFDIQWPAPINVLSLKDQNYPDFSPADFPIKITDFSH